MTLYEKGIIQGYLSIFLDCTRINYEPDYLRSFTMEELQELKEEIDGFPELFYDGDEEVCEVIEASKSKLEEYLQSKLN